MTTEDLKFTAYGGAGKVTGANFMLESNSTTILIDCGLVQGRGEEEKINYLPFKYDAARVDFLLITHAHIDHIGRIGKLIKEGFRGKIYSIDATKDLSQYMFEDALGLMSHSKNGPLYSEHDIEIAKSLWTTVQYHEEFKIGDFKVIAKDAGHILGSAIYEIEHESSGKKIAFTGDLGNSPTPLLRDTEYVSNVDYMIIESVYGDRNHENRQERADKLKEVVKKVIARKGVLIIPVFSLEKTQVLLHELNDFIETKEIPSVPIFLDSPLGIKLTKVYKNYTKYFNKHIQQDLKHDNDVFDFPKLKMTLHPEESKMIGKTEAPMIIISSSGMSDGGRINEHERRFLPNKQNAILFIGYQVSGSTGRKIKEGAKKININGKEMQINAEIITIDGYSSHKDSDGLFDFIEHAVSDKLKKVFVSMGEPKASFFLAQKIKDNLNMQAIVSEENKTYTL